LPRLIFTTISRLLARRGINLFNVLEKGALKYNGLLKSASLDIYAVCAAGCRISMTQSTRNRPQHQFSFCSHSSPRRAYLSTANILMRPSSPRSKTKVKPTTRQFNDIQPGQSLKLLCQDKKSIINDSEFCCEEIKGLYFNFSPYKVWNFKMETYISPFIYSQQKIMFYKLHGCTFTFN